MAEAPRHIPHQTVPQLLFHNYTMSTLDCARSCLSCHHTRLKAILASCLPWWTGSHYYRSWQSLKRCYCMTFLPIGRPVFCPAQLAVRLISSSSNCTFYILVYFLLSHCGFLCFPVCCLWQQTRLDTCSAPSPFFRPVIYAVRGFTLFGWPGFHVCAEQYCGLLTHSFVFSMKQIVAGNWWGFTATGTEHNQGRTDQFSTPPIRFAKCGAVNSAGCWQCKLLSVLGTAQFKQLVLITMLPSVVYCLRLRV